MAELPYPSWALMPSIGQIVRSHIGCAVMNFGWADKASFRPLATWVNPLITNIYQRFLANPQEVFDDVPIRAMYESNGRFLQLAETHPDYELTPLYQHFLAVYEARWGVSSVIKTRKWIGFMTMYREAKLGAFQEDDWEKMRAVSEVLSKLDENSVLASLPNAKFYDTGTSNLLLSENGSILAKSDTAHDMLFISRQNGMGPPEWARDDWGALPPQVKQSAQKLFASNSKSGRFTETQILPWGRFDYFLDKMQTAENPSKTLINVTIRHQEPLDIVVARCLWRWPLSPQEKRIMIASARHPTLEQLAQVLEISVGTLKNYSNELLARFNVATRPALINHILENTYQNTTNHQQELQ